MKRMHLLVQKDYKPGDQAPSGYLAWHEWAEVQHKAGLRQVQCGRCGKWQYPQQLSEQMDSFVAVGRKGKRTVETHVCNACEVRNRTSPVVPELQCKTCGSDRAKEPCKSSGTCSMVGIAYAAPVESQEVKP